MTWKPGQPSFISYAQPISTTDPNGQYKYNISYRTDQPKGPTTIATRTVAPMVPWTVYHWQSAAQHYYQQASQLRREKEAWKAHYTKLYLVHEETVEALRSAQAERDEAKKSAKEIFALRFGLKKA